MTSCHHEMDDQQERRHTSFNTLLKGAGACSLIVITIFGAFAPEFNVEYTITLQSVAAVLGAAAGLVLSLRA